MSTRYGCGYTLETVILQYILCKITDSKGLLAQCFAYFGTLFSDSFLERAFCRSGCFSVSLLAHLLVPKVVLGVIPKACIAKMMQQKECQEFLGISRKGRLATPSGRGLSWVMVLLSPLSLGRDRGGPAGNWSHPALEAWSPIKSATCFQRPLVHVFCAFLVRHRFHFGAHELFF